MEKIKISVIGCGQIVQIMHLPYLYNSDLYEIVAICDISQEIVTKVGDRFNIPNKNRFLCYKDILNVETDACLIATTDHYRPTLFAVENGKHVFVEKPFSFNLEYFDEIIKIVNQKKLIAQVGYMKLYDPAVSYAKNVIKKMNNINLIHIHDFAGSFSHTSNLFNFFSSSDIPKQIMDETTIFLENSKKRALKKDNFNHLNAYSLICGIASHDLALLRYLFGTPSIINSCVYNNNIVVAQMRYDNIPIQFESGYVDSRKIWDEKFSIYSNNINLSIEFPWPYLKNSPTKVTVNSDDREGNNVDTVFKSGYEESYHLQWEDFYNCVLSGAKPKANAAESRGDLVVAANLINQCT